MWQIGQVLRFVGKSRAFYTHGRWYQLLTKDFNTQTYIIQDDNGSSTHPWDMYLASREFTRAATAANTYPMTSIPPYPQHPQSLASSGVQTLPGGYQIYWESSETEQSSAPTAKTRYCTPKQYIGFTEIDYYCTRCNRKADSEMEIATSTCDKA